MSTDPPRAEAIKGAHQPFVPPDQAPRELTFRAIAIGAVLGIVFALSSVYLGLKVGLTVSASIPVAVLSITVFRWLRMRATILENNIVQTTGSAGESIAAGVAFTLPSLLLMGFDLEIVRVLLVALLGGLIGVLMMIPLRHGLIVKEHGKLAYPEGTACADVLMVGEKGGTEATKVFTGFFVGLTYAAGNLIFRLWGENATFNDVAGSRLKKATIGFEVSPAMLGVGYIIGPKVAGNMLAGGLLAFVVLIPLIAMFGGPEVAAMAPGAIRNEYILYIGAGAVATGGFIALGRAMPTIVAAFKRGMGSVGGARGEKVLRTERDLPMTVVVGGAAAVAVAIFAAPVLDIDFLTALLVVLFGFFFVTVSSRITGEIGSSSNPISGMTIATLLLTCGLFYLLGRTSISYKAMALTTAALVCVAASNGGTISQDLKTGFLVGATPRHQQVAILVGVVTSAIVIGFTLLLLNDSRTTFEAVAYKDFSFPTKVEGVQRSDQTMKGPDGVTYKIMYVQSDAMKTPDGTPVPRGKYMVDEKDAPVFRVDPGVSGSYPFKLHKSQGNFPETATGFDKTIYTGGKKAGRVDGTMKGADQKDYRVLVLDSAHDKLPAGRYLVDSTGHIAYKAERVAVESTKPAHAPTPTPTPTPTPAPAGSGSAAGGSADAGSAAAGSAAGSAASSADAGSAGGSAVAAGSADAPAADSGSAAPADGTGSAAAPIADAKPIEPAVPPADVPAVATIELTEMDAQVPGSLAIARDESLVIGGKAVGTDSGMDRGLDHKAYRAYDLTDVVGGLRPGRYFVDDQNHVAFFGAKLEKYDAPKAQLFRLIIDGTLGGTLPWGLVLIGVFIAFILELIGVASLPFAVGLYLSIHTSGAIFVGGLIRWLVDRKRRGESSSEAESSPGMLMASGLIAGGAICGVLQAGLLASDKGELLDLSRFLPDSLLTNESWWPMLPFLAMAAGLFWVGANSKPKLPSAVVTKK